MAAGSIDAGAPGIDEGVEQAGFPVVKQLESFDFKAIPALNKMLVLDLAHGEYMIDTVLTTALAVGGVSRSRDAAPQSHPVRPR